MRKRQAGAAGVGGSFASPVRDCNEPKEAIVTEAMIREGVFVFLDASVEPEPASLAVERIYRAMRRLEPEAANRLGRK